MYDPLESTDTAGENNDRRGKTQQEGISNESQTRITAVEKVI
jgi:hypothetical protein